MQKKFLKEISLFIDALERDTVLFIYKYNSRLNALEHKYDPDEPRAPAGGPDGGQWVSGGSGSSVLGQNDDGSDDLGTGDSLGGVPTDGINPLYPELIAPAIAAILSGVAEMLSGGALAEEGVATAEAGFTDHAAIRAAERGISSQEAQEALQTAKDAGNVVTQTGKYGTPQLIYQGSNGVTAVVETAGQNAGKIITL